MLFERPQHLRIALGAAVATCSLVWAGLAVAAPRPTGTSVAAAPAAEESVVASSGATYTRADMPRPSGVVTPVGLEAAEAPAAAATPTKLPEKKVAAVAEAGEAAAAADDGWSPDMDCSACHNVDDIKAATEDSAVLTDVNGTVVNPHDLPAIEDHAAIVCSSCHKSHEVSENTEKSAKRTCASCHHADVYECYTCHA